MRKHTFRHVPQRRFRSVCAFAQADQNLHWAHFGLPRMQSFFMRTPKTDQTTWMHKHKVNDALWISTGFTSLSLLISLLSINRYFAGLTTPMCGTNSSLTRDVTFTARSYFITVIYRRAVSAAGSSFKSKFQLTFFSFSEGMYNINPLMSKIPFMGH